MALAVQHLYDLRHRKLAYYAPWPSVEAAKERLSAFKQVTSGLGLNSEQAFFGPDVPELLMRKARPTGLVCFNDAAAVSAVRSAGSLGLDVPTDLSVIGFDDDLRAVSCIPMLTTLHTSFDELAVAAIDMILSQVAGETLETPALSVPTRLVIRESAGPVPKVIRPAT